MTNTSTRIRIKRQVTAITSGMGCMWKPGLRGVLLGEPDRHDPWIMDSIEFGSRVATALDS